MLQSRAKIFVDLGVSEINKRCDRFFDNLVRVQKDAAAVKAGFNVGGTALAGALSAVQASAKSIAMVALGTGFMEESVDVFSGAMLYELKAEDTHELVKKYQKTYLATNDLSNTPNALEAVRIIQGYAATCLPASIAGYVSTAVRAAQVKEGSVPAGETRGMASSLQNLLSTVLNQDKPLTAEQTAALARYALQGESGLLDGDAALLKALKSSYDRASSRDKSLIRSALRALAGVERTTGQNRSGTVVTPQSGAAAAPGAGVSNTFQPTVTKQPDIVSTPAQ